MFVLISVPIAENDKKPLPLVSYLAKLEGLAILPVFSFA